MGWVSRLRVNYVTLKYDVSKTGGQKYGGLSAKVPIPGRIKGEPNLKKDASKSKKLS
jgi:hypothetical protein